MSRNPISSSTPEQNPDPALDHGQSYLTKRHELVTAAMETYRNRLPSNYVASVPGPNYMLQFQAVCEQIADIQIAASLAFQDANYDFLRSEFLWEVLGALVFPRSTAKTGGIPEIEGDVTYRDFLKGMVLALLQGATAASVVRGVELLTDDRVTLIERFLEARSPGSARTLYDTFTFDVEVEGLTPLWQIPEVIEVLRPAHTRPAVAFVQTEAVTPIEDAELVQVDWSDRLYDDLRVNAYGAKQIQGVEGRVRGTVFTDVSRDFSAVEAGGTLTLEDGTVRKVLRTWSGLVDHATARPYTTTPTGLTGTATVVGGDIYDLAQDFAACVEGEVLTFSAGPNVYPVRLSTVLGDAGGPVGVAAGPASSVRPALSSLVLDRVLETGTGLVYAVTVNRLAESEPLVVSEEDVSVQFIL